MADENFTIAVTDEGTINEVAGLLELLGLKGEAALERLEGSFTNMSASQQVAEASAKAFTAAANAGFTSTGALASALDKLTTSEQKAATTQEGLARLTTLLATAQREGLQAAIALANGQETAASSNTKVTESIAAQGEATVTLTRLQQNLLAREQAANAQRLISISNAATYDAALTSQAGALDRATAATTSYSTAASRVGTAENTAAAGASELATATHTVSAAQTEAAAAIDRFIALQREANTTTITGRAATVEATAAYRAAVEAIGAEAVELELLASNQGKVADSAIRMANSINQADAALAREGAAAEASAAAVTTLEARTLALQEAGAKVGSTFGGLNAIFAGAFAGNELVKASDDFQRLQASLGLVTKGAADLDSTYHQLLATSNEFQTSLDGNVKLYVNLASSSATAGISAQSLQKAVSGIDVALKLGNVTGQDAYRVLRSLSEIFTSADGNATRFVQNLKRESPSAFKLISDAAVKLGIDLENIGGGSTKAEEHLAKLKDKLTTLQSGADGSNRSVASLTSSLNSAKNAADSDAAEIDKLSNGHYKTADAARAAQDKISALRQDLILNNTAITTYGTSIQSAKDKVSAHTEKVIDQTKAEIANATATGEAAQAQRNLIAIFTEIYSSSGEAAKSFTTVSGSLTVLKNNLIDMAGSSKTANIAVTVLKDVILLLAQNVGTVVPAVFLFGTAIAAVKVANLINDLRRLSAAFVSFLGTSIAPLIPAIAAFTAVVVGAGLAFQAVYNATHPASEQINIFKVVMADAKDLAGQFGAQIGALSQAFTDNAIHTQATAEANKVLNGELGDGTIKATQYRIPLRALTDDTVANASSAQSAASAQGELATKVDTATSSVTKASTAIKDSASEATSATSKIDEYSASFNTLANAISNAISKLVDFISKAAQAAASYLGLSGSGATSSAGGIGHARDGGTFAVAGTGPVDSKLIAVSPGEVVTVQTPMQYRQGIAPAYRSGQTRFAIGGVTAGAGVDLGTGVQLSTDSLASVGNSTTGFNDDTSANTAAVTASVTATDTNTDTTTRNTVAVATTAANVVGLTTAVINNSDVSTNTGKKAVDVANDNTQALNNNTGQLSALSSNIINGANGIIGAANNVVTAIAALPSTLSSVASSAMVGSNAAAVDAPISGTTTSGNIPGLNTDNILAPNATSPSFASLFGGASAYGPAASALHGPAQYSVGTVDVTSAAAAAKDATKKANDDVIASANLKIAGTQTFLDGLTKQADGTYLGANNSLVLQQDVDAANASIRGLKQSVAYETYLNATARDGGDFYIPGGTGVDSRLLNLAVSPGESVHIRTPAQQNNVPAASANAPIILNVTTPDAQSFVKSQNQFAQQLQRGLRRAARR